MAFSRSISCLATHPDISFVSG
ncbi:hypothetical protein MXB_5215 [Myxobolus squamalis]|nr:hypothetical protein MXB_5215 [Myxobolus squamalis]